MMKLSLQFSKLSFNTQCLSSATSKKKSPSRPMPLTITPFINRSQASWINFREVSPFSYLPSSKGRCFWPITYLEQHTIKYWFQVFSLKLEILDPMLALKITPERLEPLQRSTSQEETLQTLNTTILPWWTDRSQSCSIQRLKSSHPSASKTQLKSRIHLSHLRVEVVLRNFLAQHECWTECVIISSNAQSGTNFKL